jgi:dolichyl-diphosphooligosaccharide--protein glycosyltransferase
MRKVETDQTRLSVAHRTVLNVQENGEALFAFVLAFALAAALRLIELEHWQADHLFIDGEPLMATHDAYAWLAGAKGIGSYVDSSLAGLIRFLHQITGLQLGTIGFWLPVLTVPWLALPACLLARFMRLSEAGVIFAVMSGSSIGFLVRTRLGFCDTDLLALFFPLAFACALTAWLVVQTGQGWKRSAEATDIHDRLSVSLAILAGVCGALNFIAYTQGGSILLAVLGMSALLGFGLAPKGQLMQVWAVLVLVYALTFGGLPGLALSSLLAMVLVLRPTFFTQRHGMLILLFSTALIFFYAGLHAKIVAYFNMIMVYAKTQPVELASNASALQLPDIVQSVREAQNLQWLEMTERIAGHVALFVIGVTGYIFAVIRRPQLLVFLPFLVLGMASVKLGNRFAMYGGVTLGVGFGFGVAELLRLLGQSQGRRWIAQLALCCVVFWPAGNMMSQMQPVPVLPKVYAQTFADLRDKIESDARLWQWWDYGYAGQYYAERLTFGDGGAHDGAWLYPLARVHSTASALQANQLMKYVTQAQRMNSDNPEPVAYYWTNPMAGLEPMGALAASDFVDNLATLDQTFPSDLPAQYLVLSWENLRLGSWISYYGNWDMVSGAASPGKIQQVRGEVRLDTSSGAVLVNDAQIPVDSLDVLEQDGIRHFEWPKNAGSHVVVNQLSRQVFLMDTKMYRSMMVQMLIGDAKLFEPHFELVDDKFPWTRVYRAK